MPTASPPPPPVRPAQRYGDRPRPVLRLAVRGLLGVVCAAVVTLMVWSAWHHAHPDVASGLLGYQVLDDNRVEVHFEVAADPAARLQCDLRARNYDRQTVGSAVVDVGPAPSQRREVRAVVRTRQRPVTGELQTCRLVP